MVDNQLDKHIQVKFIAQDLEKEAIPDTIISVPVDATKENLNDLVNSIAENSNDEWKELTFDFLINGVLFRGNLEDFIVDNSIPQESVVVIECILRQPPPELDQDIPHDDWVSSVKVTSDYIFSATYGGELSILSHNGRKISNYEFGDQPLKCLDVFNYKDQLCVVIGSHDQTLTLNKIEPTNDKKSVKIVPWQVLRGHERSVECVASKHDGTRIVSGGYDCCLKVWNVEDDGKTEFVKSSGDSSKKRKIDTLTKVPMVTLQSHKDAVVDVEWHPLQSKQVVTASMDFNIISWDLELAGFVTRKHGTRAFTSISMNPVSGLIVSGTTDNKVRLWDLNSQDGNEISEIFHGHNGWVTDVCWSKQNTNQFISGGLDQTVKMWDVRSSKAPLYDIIGHHERILTVDWSYQPLIASGSADSTLKTFKVK